MSEKHYQPVGRRTSDGAIFPWAEGMERHGFTKCLTEVAGPIRKVKAHVPAEVPAAEPAVVVLGAEETAAAAAPVVVPADKVVFEEVGQATSDGLEVVSDGARNRAVVVPLTQAQLEDMSHEDLDALVANRFLMKIPARYRSKAEKVGFVLAKQDEANLG